MQRLGNNHGGYHGEQINIRDVLRKIELAANQFGWKRETFHTEGNFNWLALRLARSSTINSLSRRSEATADPLSTRLYLSTGIHGDEPAGPLAALRLIHDNIWPDDAEIVLLPCLNPIGFANNRREGSQGNDLNRDYLDPKSPEIRAHIVWLKKQAAFDVCLCLHEDWEAHGFYLYELNPDDKPSYAEAMIAAAKNVCPIDQSEIIEGREARGGIIPPSLDPSTRPQWPESFWLLQNKTRLSYTLEAPSDFDLAVRVNALVAATQAALIAATSD